MLLFDFVVILLTLLEYGKQGHGVKHNRPGQQNPRGCRVQESASMHTISGMRASDKSLAFPVC
jgi:hypothetical protein